MILTCILGDVIFGTLDSIAEVKGWVLLNVTAY